MIVSSHIESAIAAERQADLVHAGAGRHPVRRTLSRFWRRADDVSPVASAGEVTIRRARPGDEALIERLAQLDGKRVPAGPLLIAEVDGEAVAALDVAARDTVADPFAPTAHLVTLLELRARQVAPHAGGAGWEAWEPRYAA